jgi:hypothetical protein
LTDYRLIDSLGKSREIGIERAYDDPRVLGILLVESNEVLAIEGQHAAIVIDGESQDIGVWPR